MLPAARISAFIEILTEVEEAIKARSFPLDILVNQYFRARRYAGSKDRRAVTDLLYACMRQRALILWACETLSVPFTVRNFSLLYLARFEPDHLLHFTGDGRFAPEVLSDAESALIEASGALAWDKAPLSAQLNIPAWAWVGMQERFKETVLAQVEALNKKPSLDIRVNTLKADNSVINNFKNTDYIIEKNKYSLFGHRVSGSVNLSAIDAYKQGQIEVQGEASQIASLLVGAKPGMQVLDLCAGAGGKSLHVSAQMQNRGQLYACDTSDKRLAECLKRAKKGRHTNISPLLLKATGPKRAEKLAAYAGACDRVYIDAPCTGSGTWGRGPDQRWRFDTEALLSMTELQYSLLCEGAGAVKKGGYLLYMTCSVLPAENENIVTRFLANPENRNWKLYDYRQMWGEVMEGAAPETLSSLPEALQLTPLMHDTDGFFVALFELAAD